MLLKSMHNIILKGNALVLFFWAKKQKSQRNYVTRFDDSQPGAELGYKPRYVWISD